MFTVIGRNWLISVASLAVLGVPRAGWCAPQTTQQQNYVACVNGDAGNCNPGQLSANERIKVEEASLQRNYVACSNGWASGCDPLRLTSDQRRIVDSVSTQRQIAPCGSKWGMSCASPSQSAHAALPAETVSSEPERPAGNHNGAARYDLDTQRAYAPTYYESEPHYAWGGVAPWLVGGALVAAATWPLWTDWDDYYHHCSWSNYYWRNGWWGGHGYPYAYNGGHWGHGHGHGGYGWNGGHPPAYVPRPVSLPKDHGGAPMQVHIGKSRGR
jgi:hypothetical protein